MSTTLLLVIALCGLVAAWGDWRESQDQVTHNNKEISDEAR